MKIGYARTSTAEQLAGLESQERNLRAYGIDRCFTEQVSSVAKRVQLEAALDYCREGDILVVTRLDRLARSVSDFVKISERLTHKGASLVVLSMNLDTSTPQGKLMTNVMVSVAQFERELMLERQREGIAKAKAAGLYKGRIPTARRQAAAIAALRAEGKRAEEIAIALSISRASVFRVLREVPAIV